MVLSSTLSNTTLILIYLFNTNLSRVMFFSQQTLYSILYFIARSPEFKFRSSSRRHISSTALFYADAGAWESYVHPWSFAMIDGIDWCHWLMWHLWFSRSCNMMARRRQLIFWSVHLMLGRMGVTVRVQPIIHWEALYIRRSISIIQELLRSFVFFGTGLFCCESDLFLY